MEIQFKQKDCRYMHRIHCRELLTEQTQEVKLSDGSPDIGRVLGVWGQVLLRGKEWRANGIGMTGGIMAWILYEPEGGGTPDTVETWIPFQAKWDISDPQTEGLIHGSCWIQSMDARVVSARKLIVRTGLSICADILREETFSYYEPENLPQDVCVLPHEYLLKLPDEAGEKIFDLEESMESHIPDYDKTVCCRALPRVTEQKVLGDKLVFHGELQIHLVYLTSEGKIETQNFTIPFSQFQELEQIHDSESDLAVQLLVTALDTEISDTGNTEFKIGMVAQYVVYHCQNVITVEDTYSLSNEISCHMEDISAPAVLETGKESIPAALTAEMDAECILDSVFYPNPATVAESEEGTEIGCSGSFQILYRDTENKLQCGWYFWNCEKQIPRLPCGRISAEINSAEGALCTSSGGTVDMHAGVILTVIREADCGIRAVCGLDIGEKLETDPMRPSLILRRLGDSSLWELAKKYRTTREAIQKENALEGEPDSAQILLIPIP